MALHVHEWGAPDAPVVLCLHGVVAHGRRFRRLAEERLASFRVLAPDLRGHGRSTWEPPWTLQRHADDIVELLDSIGVERAAVVGHSFGGRLALELAALGRVDRAALLDPAVWVPPPIALERAEEERTDRSFASVDEALEARQQTATMAPRALLEEEMADHLAHAEDGRWRYRYSQSAVVAAYGELSQPPPDWARVQVPTLLVVGETTDVVPPAVVDALRAELGELLEVVTVPGGHIPLWDAYEQTADAIERFLG